MQVFLASPEPSKMSVPLTPDNGKRPARSGFVAKVCVAEGSGVSVDAHLAAHNRTARHCTVLYCTALHSHAGQREVS